MKILISSKISAGFHAEPEIARAGLRAARKNQSGMVVIVFLALLSIILIYVGANLHSLNSLKRELKLVEQQQLRRLAAVFATNDVATPVPIAQTNALTKPPPP